MKPIRILCCNMRGYGSHDGDNAWKFRMNACLDILES